ncbi:M48 family metallopeptidase [Hydrogenimonas urashimensis]|uniref:M48 family metallopeptidase n=1 Tax=Hydrogenimonas urashimensis TaxID=2740515 RepID=UPI001F21868D|nr:SprT family zinc-dependent metalloprotease [Hydrogenimonas urashimensis]
MRRKGQKNLYLRVKSDGTIHLSAPLSFPMGEIKSFLVSKEGWVLKRLKQRLEHARVNPSVFTEGCRAWYLGRDYPVIAESARFSEVRWEGDRFVFLMRTPDDLKRALRGFYTEHAGEFFEKRVAYWSAVTGLFPKAVRHRWYRSRWGCCSRDNIVTFNTALMCYDTDIIDYVVVHELAHIRYKHHRKPFWHLVAAHIPDYRELRKRLL